MRLVLAILICTLLTGCVDGSTGKFFICGVTTHCK